MTAGLVMQDKRLKTGRTGIQWRPAWRWPADTERFIAGLLENAPRPIVHVCAGSSKLGDVKVDMFHPSADIKGDQYNLPFPTGSVGTILCDPPFPEDGTPVHLRLRAFQEYGRVVRKGGLVMLHAPWMPGPTWGELESVHVRVPGGHSFPFAPVLLTVWRRHMDHPNGNLEADHA